MKQILLAAILLIGSMALAHAQAVVAPPTWHSIVYGSGTVATGGTAQTITWSLTYPNERCVQNPESATEDLFVAYGSTASTTIGRDLPAGQYVCEPWMGPVSVYGATTGHAYLTMEAKQ